MINLKTKTTVLEIQRLKRYKRDFYTNQPTNKYILQFALDSIDNTNIEAITPSDEGLDTIRIYCTPKRHIKLDKFKQENTKFVYRKKGRYRIEFIPEKRRLILNFSLPKLTNGNNNLSSATDIPFHLKDLHREIEKLVNIRVPPLKQWIVCRADVFINFELPGYLVSPTIEAFSRITYPYLGYPKLEGDTIKGYTASYRSESKTINIYDKSNQLKRKSPYSNRIDLSENNIIRIEFQLKKSGEIKKYLDKQERILANVLEPSFIEKVLTNRMQPFLQFIFMDGISARDELQSRKLKSKYDGLYKFVTDIATTDLEQLKAYLRGLYKEHSEELNEQQIAVLGRFYNKRRVCENKKENDFNKRGFEKEIKESEALIGLKEEKAKMDLIKAKEYLSTKETAKYIGLSNNTVYAMITDGKLPYILFGKRKLIRKVDIDKMMEIGLLNPLSK